MTTELSTDSRLEALLDTTERITGPGMPFEIAVEPVLGEELKVFRNPPTPCATSCSAQRDTATVSCYVFGDGSRIRFDELVPQIASVACALRDRHGIEPGDRVAVCAGELPRMAVDVLGRCRARRGARRHERLVDGTRDAQRPRPHRPKLIVMDEKRRAPRRRARRTSARDGTRLRRAHRRHVRPCFPTRRSAEDDPFMLIFTSGTTGRPKAAVLSHRSVDLVPDAAVVHRRPRHGDGRRAPPRSGRRRSDSAPYPAVPRVGHVDGGASDDVGRHDGLAARPLRPRGRDRPDPAGGHHGVGRRHDPHRAPARAPRHRRPSTRRRSPASASAARPRRPTIIRRIEERFPHLTGTMSIGLRLDRDRPRQWAPNWMLGPRPTASARHAHDRGPHHRRRRDGGPARRGGQHRRPQLACRCSVLAERRCQRRDDPPGRWVHTGDFGRLQDGMLYIASRQRDLIIRGGENIYPFEIENRLDEHPDVVEAAAYGVDDAVLGQEVMAVVVVRRARRSPTTRCTPASARRRSLRTRCRRPASRSAPSRSPATPTARS